MAPDEPRGREMPLLVYLLVASFVLMLLSGLMFMAGLPEAQARALFLATVVIWIALGVWAIVDGQLDVGRIAAAHPVAKAKGASKAGSDVEGPVAPQDPDTDDGGPKAL